MLRQRQIPSLSISALGVVFGDIGTSPLYAIRETLGNLPINNLNILGVLSLIFWSLILIISVKYLIIVFRADNDGEGGSLALLALLKQKNTKHEKLFYFLAIFGAGLLLGDGMLTPAISVTSSIEGLNVISPNLSLYVVPLSCIILIGLFYMQSYGSMKIGKAFGPILFIWFIVLAVLGLRQILINPMVIEAINPYYAYEFLYANGFKGYILLGGVFLVVTGGEALYADLGHFGKNPIRYSWFLVVLPCLLLNYFGQGANLLLHPEEIINPFYMLSPKWFLIPLLILSAIATMIASQSVITATFSLTKQAILLGLCPRIPIIQTSKDHFGQIYIPQMNFVLLLGTLLLIFNFKNSGAMAHAYGIAVNLVMFLVTLMVAYAANKVWLWSLAKVTVVFSIFLIIDVAFLGANAHKFLTGGWIPVLFALIVAFIMYTWSSGVAYLQKTYYKQNLPQILKQLNSQTMNKLQGVTTVFITDLYDISGSSFLHFLKLNITLPEHILIVNHIVHNTPHVKNNKYYEYEKIDRWIYKITLHYGFMDTISIPHGLSKINTEGVLPFLLNIQHITYLVEIPNIIASKYKKTLFFYWQEVIFSFLMRNYSTNLNIEFYNLPYNRTIAIGSCCVI